VAPVVRTSSTRITRRGGVSATRNAPPRRPPPIHGAPARLRAGLADALQEPAQRQAGTGGESPREDLCLVESALATTASRQRHPRDRLIDVEPVRGRPRHRLGERVGDDAGAAELQPVQRPARGLVVRERRPRPADRLRGAVGAHIDRPLERAPAPNASGRRQDAEALGAPFAERPLRRSASGAPPRIEEIEDQFEPDAHGRPTLPRPTDASLVHDLPG
jgi:hypothetical protein